MQQIRHRSEIRPDPAGDAYNALRDSITGF